MAKERSMALREELNQFLGNAKKEIKQLYEKIKQRPLTCLICIIIIVTAIVLLIGLPHWQVSGINNVTEKVTLENQSRATLAQILGGVAVGIGIYFAWGNLTTAREGQITERFTRAIDQLGSDKLEIRLGGIYALERISRESEKDYWPIMEILTAYVRLNSNVDKLNGISLPVYDLISMDIQANESTKKQHSKLKKLPLDIQSILTILGKRKYACNDNESKYLEPDNLDLNNTYLEMIELKNAHLEGANFKRAYLQRAYIKKTHFEEADFEEANLENAQLFECCLEGVNFENGHLENAYITKSNLKNIFSRNAHLQGVNFFKSNLERAFLPRVNFRNAFLLSVNLAKANLEGANFEGANLKKVKNLTIDQLSKVKTLYKAELDPELEAELRAKGYSHLLDDEPDDEPGNESFVFSD
ncbi:pentapeptide repeat-containing protein [Methanosarcina hadiensis]|uniref:pentapeptide repeat-containing protein n=1 Tax=Methanosarcina hadiensis TaxID=3078083 RepID=UPI003977C4CA